MALTDVLSGVADAARALLGPSRAMDVVAVTDAGFAPLFPSARPLTASVFEFAGVMEHPVETGAVIADHIVFKPVEIELPLLCVGDLAYRATYSAIRTTFMAGTLLTVRTRTGSYPNMVITDLPHEEAPEMFDGISIRVRLREAKFVTPKTSPASTRNRGAQQTSTPNASTSTRVTAGASASGQGAAPRGSTLYRWAYE